MTDAVELALKAISENTGVYEAIAKHYDISIEEAKQLFKETVKQIVEPN